jgi:hypothetical protein
VKKSLIAMSVIGAVVIAGCIALQPIGTVKSLEASLASKDEARIKELVDFATLKQNIKYRLRGEVEAASTEAGAAGGLEGLVSVFGDALLDQAVTPQGTKPKNASGSIGSRLSVMR